MDGDCTYAVVDMSKKKKKNRSLPEKGEDSAEATGAYSTMALYSVVDKELKRLEEDESETVAYGEPCAETGMDADPSKAQSLPTVSFSDATVSTTSNIQNPTVKGAKRVQQSTGCFIAVAVALAVFAIIISLACFGVVFAEINKLKSVPPASQQTSNGENIPTNESISANELLRRLTVHESLLKSVNMTLATEQESLRNEIFSTIAANLSQLSLTSDQVEMGLSMLEQVNNNTQETVRTALEEVAQNFTEIESTFRQFSDSIVRTPNQSFFLSTSCADLPPSSPSGYYLIRDSNGFVVHVYCDMNRSCGGVTGGWMRVAELDMTDCSHQCPHGLSLNTSNNLRTCVRNTDSAGCSSVHYSTANIRYSRVCGKVIAYQIGTTNAFNDRRGSPISSDYVDGVSFTHGISKNHIWTFASALAKDLEGDFLSSGCSCFGHSDTPSFVGTDYLCDSGLDRYRNGDSLPGFLAANPLWDGAGCETTQSPNNCCNFDTPPWFYKDLPQSTTDDIEMRVCRDEVAGNEDIAVEMIEIYVQ